jgi:hypothetical protein
MNQVVLSLVILALALPAPSVSSKGPSHRSKTGAKSAPCPTLHSIDDCPDEGCGGQHDPALNTQKNIHPADDQQAVLGVLPGWRPFLILRILLPKPKP